MEFSETTTTKKTLRKTLLKIQKTGSDAQQLYVYAHVKLSDSLFKGPIAKNPVPVDPVELTQEVKLKRVPAQLLFSVLARIAEAIREQYSQNPEKRALSLADLKLDAALKEDIQVLLTSSVRSFYSKVTSKKAPLKLDDPEKNAEAEAK